MKQLKLILTVAVAAIICSCAANGNTNGAQQANAASETPAAQGSIVYIQLDSLVNQYDMYNDLKSELESKVQAVQEDLTKKGRSFESAVKDFQAKIDKGLLTRSQAEEQQQKLVEREQNLQGLSQQKQMELAEEEAVMMRRVMDAIQTYITKYNQDKGYALILSVPVLAGDPSLNITQDILAGLNEEYIKSKNK
ncbi:MAG: OmpH family outer membrane protein [Bacteroidales bacterium]|nr:OmpH family outer membrane protein [Bacteroidales bacterium]